MIQNTIGKDMKISKMGYGSWALGNPWTSEKDAFEVLETFLQGGGNFIDTAQGYKVSEERIGKFLKERNLSNQVIVASKTAKGGTMETVSEIELAVDDSLRKLQRDYVDIYYFHSPPEDVETMNAALDVLESLVKKGKIRGIGASIKGPTVSQKTVDICKQYIDTGKIQVIQLIYSLLRQKNEDIFSYAKEHGVALVGRTSLESGFLTGKYEKDFRFPEEDYRSKWNPKFAEIWNLVAETQEKYGGQEQVKELALRFAMSPEAITSTIIGARNKTQMEQLLQLQSMPALDESLREELKVAFSQTQDVCNPD